MRSFSRTPTDGVPKVPKGCSEGFCHFWHPAGLRISKFTFAPSMSGGGEVLW